MCVFMNMDWLQSHGLAVERANYDLVYTARLPQAKIPANTESCMSNSIFTTQQITITHL